MAASLTRFTAIRKILSVPYWRRTVSAPRYYGNGAQEGPVDSGNRILSDLEQATGIERKEVEALMAGIEDPFNLSLKTGPRGTREKPTLVPSVFGERIVGCLCEEDATQIIWMNLKKGGAQRCECGYWYQLVEANPNKL